MQAGSSAAWAFCGPRELGAEQGRSQPLLKLTLPTKSTPPGTHQAEEDKDKDRQNRVSTPAPRDSLFPPRHMMKAL